MKWKPAQIGAETFDLSHLHPFSFDFVVPAKDGKPPQVYPIDVLFSLHCFTRGIRAGEKAPAELAYSDSRETRLFDQVRYHHSALLPGIVADIGKRKCFHTGRGNFFTLELVRDDGTTAEYTVYFTVSRSRAPGRLTLYVQSAYLQDGIPRRRPQPRKPIRFSVIAFNVSTGKAIKPPR